MQQPVPTEVPTLPAPSFYLTARQPLRPGAILLASVAAFAALSSVLYAMEHNRSARFTPNSSGAARSANATSGATPDDDKDDPNQVDTIVLGDPADAPVPARKGNHVSPVHATILVRLPRYGDQVGLIPDTPAGHLLYNWLAAFNQASYPALGNALPNIALASAAASQMELRQQTGGFSLLRPKRSNPASSSFASATRLPPQPKSSAPSRYFQTPPRPASRASASALFPHSGRTPPQNQPHRDESMTSRPILLYCRNQTLIDGARYPSAARCSPMLAYIA